MTSPAEAGARRRALVVGTGLIGGSIALGLRRRGWHVSGLDADEERLPGRGGRGVIDAAGDDLRGRGGLRRRPRRRRRRGGSTASSARTAGRPTRS